MTPLALWCRRFFGAKRAYAEIGAEENVTLYFPVRPLLKRALARLGLRHSPVGGALRWLLLTFVVAVLSWAAGVVMHGWTGLS